VIVKFKIVVYRGMTEIGSGTLELDEQTVFKLPDLSYVFSERKTKEWIANHVLNMELAVNSNTALRIHIATESEARDG
jgi:hydrogenase maturation factor HypE